MINYIKRRHFIHFKTTSLKKYVRGSESVHQYACYAFRGPNMIDWHEQKPAFRLAFVVLILGELFTDLKDQTKLGPDRIRAIMNWEPRSHCSNTTKQNKREFIFPFHPFLLLFLHNSNRALRIHNSIRAFRQDCFFALLVIGYSIFTGEKKTLVVIVKIRHEITKKQTPSGCIWIKIMIGERKRK